MGNRRTKGSRKSSKNLEKPPAIKPSQPHPLPTAEQVQIRQEVTQSFSGPIPPPAVLEQYDKAVQGSGNVIMDQFVLETAHRHQLEDRDEDRRDKTESLNGKLELRGQIFAFILFSATLTAGFVLVALDKTLIGIGTLLFAMITPATLLIFTRKRETPGMVNQDKADSLVKK